MTESKPRARPFTLADAMILAAAAGLGLALIRPAILLMWHYRPELPRPQLGSWEAWARWFFGRGRNASGLAQFCNITFMRLLIVFAPATILVRLRRPRPRLKELLRQPGFVACAAVAIGIVFAVNSGLLHLPFIVPHLIVLAVVPLSWAVLIMTRTWHIEPGWIDGLGRTVGVLFTLSVMAHILLTRLPL